MTQPVLIWLRRHLWSPPIRHSWPARNWSAVWGTLLAFRVACCVQERAASLLPSINSTSTGLPTGVGMLAPSVSTSPAGPLTLMGMLAPPAAGTHGSAQHGSRPSSPLVHSLHGELSGAVVSVPTGSEVQLWDERMVLAEAQVRRGQARANRFLNGRGCCIHVHCLHIHIHVAFRGII